MPRPPRVFNPEDYLWTPEGRVFTAERNATAWEELARDSAVVVAAALAQSELGFRHIVHRDDDAQGEVS